MRELARFEVAGESYRKWAIASLGTKNPDYDLPPNKMIEKYGACKKVFRYIFEPMPASIVPEPTNPYDKNALKVVIGNTHVGYIPRTETSRARRYLRCPWVHWIATVTWGPFREAIVERMYSREEDLDFSISLSVLSEVGREPKEIECRTHWFPFVLPGVISFYLLSAGIAGVLAKSTLLSLLVALLIIAAIFSPVAILYFTQYIAIDSGELTAHLGIIRPHNISVPLSNIHSGAFFSSFLGKKFGYYTVIITSDDGIKYKFKFMSHGDDFVYKLKTVLH